VRFIGMRRTILAVAVLVIAAGFKAGEPQPEVSGSYTSNWGSVVLHQSHDRVTGEYAYQHGRIDGVLDGNVLRYAWHENDGEGHGVFVVATGGELVGTWGIGDDDTRGGGWRLAPAAAAIAR
jgi:hypothetical protein